MTSIKCLKLGSNLFSVELLIILAGWCPWPTEAVVIITGYYENEFELCEGDFYNKTDLSDDDRTLTLDDCAELCTEDPDCYVFSFSSVYEVCKLFDSQGCDCYDLVNNAAYSTYHAKNCEDLPPALANGSPTAANFAYKSPAAYQCDPNYAKTGNDNMTCLESEDWEGELPRCAYQNYFNCKVHCEYANETDTVTLMCPGDYQILIVYANLGWDPASVCTPPGVTDIECLNPEVNENLKHYCDGKALCVFDVDLDSDLFCTCDECEETLSSILQLEYKCVQNLGTDDEICEVDEGCSDDYSITNGTYTTIMDETGASINYSCDLGFEFNARDDDGDNSILVACTNTGLLEFPAPQCVETDCGSLSLSTGKFMATLTTYGATGTISCPTGYEIGGASSLEVECTLSGDWSTLEDCTPVECVELVLDNASFSATDGTAYGDSGTITCFSGYEFDGLESVAINCTAAGSWSITDDCTAKDCGPLSFTNGTFTPLGTTFPNSGTLSCVTGYEVDGQTTKEISCTADGTWSSTDDCTVVDCGNLDLVNATFSATDGTEFLAIASVICNDGYKINGETTLEIDCQSTGIWSSIEDCSAVDCGRLTLDNALFDAPIDTTLDNSATITCKVGYETATGGSELTVNCLASGSWSSSDDCTAVNCGEPTLVNATFNALSGTTFDNSATIACKAGFETVTGDSDLEVNCLASGLWSSSDDCTVVDCGTRAVENGNFDDSAGTTYGITADITCDNGHRINGDQSSLEVTCTASGQWSSTEECTPVDCGDAPAAPTSGSRSVTMTTFESTVTYSCESTHLLEGEAELTCQADGMWSGVAPDCKLLNQYVQIAVLQTDKDCLDYNENTLADLLESASDDIKTYLTQQLEMIPEKYRDTATIKIIGIRCASPLSFVVEIQLGTTANETDTIAQLNIILQNTTGETLAIEGGSTGSIEFVSVNSSDRSVALYNCNPGYYIDIIKEECLPCAKNTYQPNAIQELCLACPSGTFTEGLATTGNEEDVCIPEAESNSASLVLGLAIGLPLGLLLIIGLIIAVIYVCRKYYLNSRMARREMLPERVYRRRAVQRPLTYHNTGYDGPYTRSFGPVRH